MSRNNKMCHENPRKGRSGISKRDQFGIVLYLYNLKIRSECYQNDIKIYFRRHLSWIRVCVVTECKNVEVIFCWWSTTCLCGFLFAFLFVCLSIWLGVCEYLNILKWLIYVNKLTLPLCSNNFVTIIHPNKYAYREKYTPTQIHPPPSHTQTHA